MRKVAALLGGWVLVIQVVALPGAQAQGAVDACAVAAGQPGQPAAAAPVPGVTDIEAEPRQEVEAAPVVEPDPRVHAFYYSWYRSPEVDGAWVEWQRSEHSPPEDLASDYYPELGAYSSNDADVVRQHMQWMAHAGIGVVVVSWAGVGHPTNSSVQLVLDSAAEAGMHVAWQIEPYSGRTGNTVEADIADIYAQYGQHPAFWWVARVTRYGPTLAPRGVFYVFESCGIDAASWRSTLDRIHRDPSRNAIVLGQTTDACFIDGCGPRRESHFDGLYSYDTLQVDGAAFARVVPEVARRQSVFSASVGPGYAAVRTTGSAQRRARYREDAGCSGFTYWCMWSRALASQADWISITSFNEWHEGTQIEPAQVADGYGDYGRSGSDVYLDLTAWNVLRLGLMRGSAR